MAGGPCDTLIRHLRRAARVGAPEGLSDAQLLERFVAARDEAAFEALVWRHGAMVLGVCLRVLRQADDAEDAFQATFLALVRKAGSIGKRQSVGSWLYKVAYRVALRARRRAPAGALCAEALADRAPGPEADLLGRELGSVLDEEVSRLADRYRTAFVLCQLEGQTIEAAARALGCPPGTVGTRVARARELLRRRLARRGYGSTALDGRAWLALPAALVGSTVRAALLGTADEAAATGVISARAAGLTKGVLRAMKLTRWARALAVVVSVGLLGPLCLALHRGRAVEAPEARAEVLAPRAPEPEKGVVLAWKFVPGEPFYQEVTTETAQTMKVMGKDVEQSQKQTFYLTWAPIHRAADGWELDRRVDGVKLAVDIGGSKVEYDSTLKKGADNPLADFYRALVGTRLRVTLGRDNAVTKVSGREALLERAAGPAAEVLRKALSEDAVRLWAQGPFGGLPSRAVRPGDSWAQTRKLELGPLGAYEAKYWYTYAGREGKLDRIKMEVGRLRPVGGDGKVRKGGLRCAEGTGTLLFDRARGRTVYLCSNLKLEGRLTMTVDGKEVEVELSQREKVVVKTTDTSPLGAARPADARDREIERLRQENERLRRQLRAVQEALKGERPLRE